MRKNVSTLIITEPDGRGGDLGRKRLKIKKFGIKGFERFYLKTFDITPEF